jgi:hypothetical protein
MTILAIPSRRQSIIAMMGRRSAVKTRAFRPRTAAPKTSKVYVASPTVPGAREEVQRVVHSLEQMHRSKQIGDRLFQAGQMFRAAYDAVLSQMGGAMDFDRVRGGGSPGKPFADVYLDASGRLNGAQAKLYKRDYIILVAVAAEGHSVKSVAEQFGMAYRDCGFCLRSALGELANLWEIDIKYRRDDLRARLVVHRDFDPRVLTSSATEIKPGKTAHADRRGVKMSGSN